jgi:hypothetical protein
MEKFELTKTHIKLLNSMYVNDVAYGAPAIDSKRPYGNSAVASDIYEIVHGEEWDNDEEMPDEVDEEMLAIHRETATALQIVLCTKSFEPGVYEKKNRYDDLSWRKIE